MKLDENASCSFMISHHNSPPSDILCKQDCIRFSNSVTRLKSSNVYKSCPKMISLEKRLILTPLQKLLKNVQDLGKLIVAKDFKSCPMSNKSPNLVTLVCNPRLVPCHCSFKDVTFLVHFKRRFFRKRPLF